MLASKRKKRMEEEKNQFLLLPDRMDEQHKTQRERGLKFLYFTYSLLRAGVSEYYHRLLAGKKS